MASIDFEAKTLTAISCTVGGTEYAEAVASARFIPAQTINTWKGGTPDAVFSSSTKPTYTCAMKLGQDYETSGSLANYLMAHAGEAVSFVFRYNGGRTITATLLIAAPEIGGDIDAILDTTITHGVSGVPVLGTIAP